MNTIYKITHPNHPECCYIGSTTQSFIVRKSNHKTQSLYPDKFKSLLYDIYRLENRDGFIFEVLEELQCDRPTLLIREQHYINEYKPSWNKIKSYRTEDQHREYEKIRQQQDKVKNYKREWYLKNRESILQKIKKT
jgi:hypothetical protein